MTILEMFLDKINFKGPNGCHLWIAALSPIGYGRFQVKRKSIYAHRFSYLLHKGLIPKGICVLHKCDIRNCVNPDHLFLGTYKDNTQDMIKKQRRHSTLGTNNGQAKLNEEQIKSIRNDPRKVKIIAKEYNVTKNHIYRIKSRIRWKHI